MSKITKTKMEEIKKSALSREDNWIKVGMSTCGIAAGAKDVYDALIAEKKERNCNISILRCGCAGMGFAEPLVEVSVRGMPKVIYGKVTKEIAREIIDKHVMSKRLLNDNIFNVKV